MGALPEASDLGTLRFGDSPRTPDSRDIEQNGTLDSGNIGTRDGAVRPPAPVLYRFVRCLPLCPFFRDSWGCVTVSQSVSGSVGHVGHVTYVPYVRYVRYVSYVRYAGYVGYVPYVRFIRICRIYGAMSDIPPHVPFTGYVPCRLGAPRTPGRCPSAPSCPEQPTPRGRGHRSAGPSRPPLPGAPGAPGRVGRGARVSGWRPQVPHGGRDGLAPGTLIRCQFCGRGGLPGGYPRGFRAGFTPPAGGPFTSAPTRLVRSRRSEPLFCTKLRTVSPGQGAGGQVTNG